MKLPILDTSHKWNQIFAFLCLPYLTQHNVLKVHPYHSMCPEPHSFLQLSNIPLYVVIRRFISGSIYLVFVPIYSTRALKTLGILSNERNKGFFSAVNEVTFGMPLGHLRMGAGCWGNQLMGGWKFLSHPLSSGRGEDRIITSVG